MAITIKNKWLFLTLFIVLVGILALGWCIGHKRADRVSETLISALHGTIKQYAYKIGELEKTAIEKDQIIVTQNQAIQTHLIEKAELKKLNIKKVAEITTLKSQIRILLDSIAHTGKVVIVPSSDTLAIEYPAIYLPFTFGEQNNYLDLKGRFDEEGKMSMDLTIPLSVDVVTGKDKSTKQYKAVVTSDNPYIKFIDVQSLKMDLGKPKRFGIGIQGGYGINFKDKVTAQLYFGFGISYNLLMF